MIRIHRELREGGFRARMILQVHDELLFETPADEIDRLRPLVKNAMEQAYPLSVPLLVDVKAGPNWRDMS
jgi:DNA polymerase-1